MEEIGFASPISSTMNSNFVSVAKDKIIEIKDTVVCCLFKK